MIPKIIHYCWLGGKPKPKSVLKCIESWKKFCPDYEIIEWNESNLDFESAPPFAKQAYDAKAYGFVPDYFRLAIIYEHGGIYFDTDVQVLKSFDPLLENKAFIGFEIYTSINLGVGFGAEPKNPLIYEHLKLYDTISFLNDDGRLNKIPSPIITTDFLVKKGAVLGENKIQKVEGVTLYPKEYFAPKAFDTGITKITKNTYSIHQYDASWFSDEELLALKKSRRKYKLDKIRYFPNKVLKWILGEKNYEKIRSKFKKRTKK